MNRIIFTTRNQVALKTKYGELVAVADLPDFHQNPEAIIWDGRVFHSTGNEREYWEIRFHSLEASDIKLVG